MSNFDHGRRAEQAAVDFLVAKGCTVHAQNWRTRWCEIDIIAIRKQSVFFCEVKYRSNYSQGDGFDYITDKKLRQMHFAAEFWMATHGQTMYDESQLCIITVTGPRYAVTHAIKMTA